MQIKESRFGKGLQQNPEVVARNQLNGSKAKVQYTFSHSDRFSHNQRKSSAADKFYDLPNLWKPKDRSMGYGSKVDLAKQNVLTPAPGQYSMGSAFIKKQDQGITMAPGRQIVRNRDIFGASKMKSPTATSYKPVGPTNTRAYTMGKKLDAGDNKWINMIPGPGKYSVLQLTNERSKKMVSKYTSALGGQFSKQNKDIFTAKNVPGPGQHEVRSYDFGDSIYEKPYSSKFGGGNRKGLSDKTLVTPGPGSYQAFSEFLR